jgi:hypothetical protein
VDVLAVVDAPTVRSAAGHIAWWHSDWEWSQVSDSALNAAKRLRHAARRCLTERAEQNAFPESDIEGQVSASVYHRAGNN